MLAVDVHVDIVCPWCFVGSERLERVLSQPALAGVTVTYHPFMLDPSTPPEGIDVARMLERKYGVDPRRLWARVEDQARDSGFELDLSRQRLQYPTVRAHTLIRHAHAKGTQRALVRALFRANFVDARDVSDATVLADVATEHGFEVDEAVAIVTDEAQLRLTRRAAEAAAAMGIEGVPFFVFNQRLAVGGAQSEAVLREAIAQAQALPADGT